MIDREHLSSLPGAEIALPGLADLAAGTESEDAAAVAMASARLAAAGLDVPPWPGAAAPAHRLYELIARSGQPDPHSRYNAIVRRMVSFCGSLEHARAGER